ncbi:hypothetical protein F2P81_014084 [Scophthalmus maximus]|uniref:Uncharacterized protein n=1 Tax=Scophthalmus maximus TaxID=52904 RepID=A0A6A4SPF0_SCOMX|nr:hypothetical protein F2P81_014084 [Scophthalmus maximus]
MASVRPDQIQGLQANCSDMSDMLMPVVATSLSLLGERLGTLTGRRFAKDKRIQALNSSQYNIHCQLTLSLHYRGHSPYPALPPLNGQMCKRGTTPVQLLPTRDSGNAFNIGPAAPSDIAFDQNSMSVIIHITGVTLPRSHTLSSMEMAAVRSKI